MSNVKEKETEVATREFEVFSVKELTTQDGRKFNAYRVVMKGNRLMDMRFPQAFSGNKPTEPCIIVVPEDACSVDERGRFPVLWVKQIVEIKPKPPKKSNISTYFD